VALSTESGHITRFGFLQFIMLLQVQPKFCRVAKILRKTKRGIGSDAALILHDRVKAISEDSKLK
jgi:hypothetical protein